MIIYQSTAKEFKDTVDEGRILEAIESAFRSKLGRGIPPAERDAYTNSLPQMILSQRFHVRIYTTMKKNHQSHYEKNATHSWSSVRHYFLRDDQQKLEDYLRKYVKYGKGMDILYENESGKIKPSKKLVDYVSGMFEGKEEHRLLDAQKVAFERARISASCESMLIAWRSSDSDDFRAYRQYFSWGACISIASNNLPPNSSKV